MNALFWFMSGAMLYHYRGSIPALKGFKFAAVLSILIVLIFFIKNAYGSTNGFSNLVVIIATGISMRNIPHNLTSNARFNFGYCSYSIYIFHYAIMMVFALIFERTTGIKSNDIANYWAWLLFFPPVLFLSWSMYFLGEKQCNGILQKMKKPSI